MGLGTRTMAAVGQALARRTMCSLAQRQAGGSVTPWKPKIAVYRHLSPFEMEPITPFNKWFNEYRSKFFENYHWVLAPAYFFGVKLTGDYIFEQYAWEHALHPEHDE